MGVSVVYLPKSCINHYYHGVSFLKIIDQCCNTQNRRSGEMTNFLFDTYKNSAIPYGNHMFQTASDMAVAKMCAYPSSNYSLIHWKCVLRCCAQCPRIYLPSTE